MQTVSPIRLMLVDDQAIVLWALRRLVLEQQGQMEVVSAASTCSEVLQRAVQSQPHVIVLDCDVEGGGGAALIPRLVAELRANVLLFTNTTNEQTIDRAVLDGVRGMVRKSDPPERLLDAVRKIHAGEIWIDRKTSGRLLSDLAQVRHGRAADSPQSRLSALTPREQAILNAMAQLPGARNKQLARHLAISEHTLRNHLSSIFGKLELRTRYDLFSFASQHLPKERHQVA